VRTTTSTEVAVGGTETGAYKTSNVGWAGMMLRDTPWAVPTSPASSPRVVVQERALGVTPLVEAVIGASLTSDPGAAQQRAARPSRPAPALPDEMLGIIRAAFSLTVTELAQVLHVRRPAVYSWLAGDAEPREQNLRRLISLTTLAEHWMDVADAPLGAGRRLPGPDGRTPLEILSQEVLDEDLGAALEPWARARASTPRGQGGRRAAALVGRDGPVPAARDSVPFETGQRTSPE
jgi:DNA-binding transcriptional regulator YiaG